MGQALPGHAEDEALGKQAAELLADVGRRRRECLRHRRQLLLQPGLFGEQGSHQAGDFLGDQADLALGRGGAGFELGPIHRPGLIHAGALQGRRHQLILQLLFGAQGHEQEGDIAQAGQAFFDELDLILQGQGEQPAQAGAMGDVGLFLGVEGAQGDALALIDKTRETHHRPSAHIHFE